MFLRGFEELGNPGRERLVVNRIACTVLLLTNEKGEDLNKMRVERDFLESQVIHYKDSGQLPFFGTHKNTTHGYDDWQAL